MELNNMSNTLKTIFWFSIIIVASFFILLGAIYVQGLPAPVVTPVTTATNTQIVWNPSDITSPSVNIYVLKQVNDNPKEYDLEETLATSTPNTGNAGMITLQSDEEIQVACPDGVPACTSVYINPFNL